MLGGRYFECMTHLVPELRVDKNGKTVTKHVRPIAKGNPSSQIPAPLASPAVVSTGKKENRIRQILGGMSINNGMARERLEERLRNMEPDTFDRIERVTNIDAGSGLVPSLRRWITKIVDEPNEDTQDMYLNAIDALEDDYKGWTDVRTLGSLKKIPEFAPHADDLREAPEHIKEAARRLGNIRIQLRGFHSLYLNTSTTNRMVSRELESLLINDPNGAASFSDWIEENSDRDIQSLDSDLALRAFRNHHERAPIAAMLNEGVDNEVVVLALDRPEAHEEILHLYRSGITKGSSIREVIDGNVKSTFATGIL